MTMTHAVVDIIFFFSSRRRHTRLQGDWSSDVCSSDLLRDEHDPDWQVAMVRVTSKVRGAEKGAVIPVVFAASRDIMWFNSPKPKSGEEIGRASCRERV